MAPLVAYIAYPRPAPDFGDGAGGGSLAWAYIFATANSRVWHLTGKGFPEDTPERIDVGAGV
jgi:hypothetical protein